MQQMIDQAEQLNPALPLYHCNACRNAASQPVLTPCGHLHCWKCLHALGQCPACGRDFEEEELFAVFVDEQHAQQGNAIPPKPKPKYSRRIKNSGGINSEGTGMMLFQNNLEAEAQLAGFGFFPPLILHATNSLEDQPQQNHQLSCPSWKLRASQSLLIVIILLMLILS